MGYRDDTLLSNLFDKMREAKFEDDKITFIETKTDNKESDAEKAATKAAKDSEKVVDDAQKAAADAIKDDEVKTQVDTKTASDEDKPKGTAAKEAPIKDSKIAEAFDIDQSVIDSIVEELGIDTETINIEQLKKGLKEEQEHEDVTGGDKIMTAKIVLAHLAEIPDYYDRLSKMHSDYEAEVKGEKKEDEEEPEEVEEPTPEPEEESTPPDESRVNETGEMSQRDIEPGGDDHDWASEIQKDVEGIEKLTNGKLKFGQMHPFDKYQGPYATVVINGKKDKIWDAQSDVVGRLMFVENLKWIGTTEDIADAINGDENATARVKKNYAEGDAYEWRIAEKRILGEAEVTYRVLANSITDKGVADRLAQDNKGIVMQDPDAKDKVMT